MAEKIVKDSPGLVKDLVNDCISRQAAIDALENIDCSDGIGISALKCDVVEDAINAINALLSAQPERKKGEWIEREVTHIDDLEAKDIITAWQSCKCSVCGRYDTRPYMYYFNAPKYCSWCGAEMGVSK